MARTIIERVEIETGVHRSQFIPRILARAITGVIDWTLRTLVVLAVLHICGLV